MNVNSFEFVESVLIKNITDRSNDIYNFNRYKMGRYDLRPNNLKSQYTRESYLDHLIEKNENENKEDRLKLESIRNKIKNRGKFEEPEPEIKRENEIIITKDNVSDHCEACKAYGKKEDCFLCSALLKGIKINIVEPERIVKQ